jgi:hypothetical protein
LLKRERDWQEREANYKESIRRLQKRLNKAHVKMPRLHLCHVCSLSNEEPLDLCYGCIGSLPCKKFCNEKGAVNNGRTFCSQECCDAAARTGAGSSKKESK